MANRARTPIIALLGLLAALLAPAQAVSADAGAPHRTTVTYRIPGDAVFPEGVAFDPRTGYFYVSSIIDATIYRGHLNRRTLEVFLPGGADGRTDANGLKVDGHGRLYVAGGSSGRMYVYDTRTRALIRAFNTPAGDGFVNDVTVDRHGDAYFTDSLRPVLWRVRAADVRAGAAPADAEAFLDFDGTVLGYEPGFNLNGLVATADGRALYTVQTNTGELFRIDLRRRSVAQVTLVGTDLASGDGMLRAGSRLVINVPDRNTLATLRLSADGLTATGVSEYTDPTFRYPTTTAFARGQVLVVNSQLDKLFSGQPPELPFTVSGVPAWRVLGHK